MCGRGRPRVHGVSRAHVRLPCQKQGRTHLGWARKRGGTHLGWVRKQGGLHPRFGIYGTEQASPAPEDAPCFLVPASPHFGPARPIHLKSASSVLIGTYPLGRAGRPYPKPHLSHTLVGLVFWHTTTTTSTTGRGWTACKSTPTAPTTSSSSARRWAMRSGGEPHLWRWEVRSVYCSIL